MPGSQGQTGITRRTVLAASGACAVSTVLVACAPGGAGSDGASSAAKSSPMASGSTLIRVSDVPVGGAVTVTVDDHQVLVTQATAGTIAAFSASCTHEGCKVQPGDGELACPCHGARFALGDGAVLAGPAPSPLHPFPVTVTDGSVTVA